MSNLLNNALDWSTGSIIPSPPLERGKVITSHFTLDRALPSVLPDHKKFQINVLICKMHDLEKIQQGNTYHVIANNTCVATIIRPTRECLVELRNNSFFLYAIKRGIS